MIDNRCHVVSIGSVLIVLAGLNHSSRAEELLKVASGIHLPQAVSSFGAVGSDGWLYVYGGHIAPTHNYSTEAVSGDFHRLKFSTGDQPDGDNWEKLPGGPRVQGMNLAAHAGKIYRAGGMEPRNKPGEPVDNHSRDDFACFDPARNTWEELPRLPQGRSSHDIAVVGDKLYVVGGWDMHGKAGNDWLDHALVMDLSGKEPTWQKLEQPFQRRALTAASHASKLYVLGGFTEHNSPELLVDLYDPETGKWSRGPNLPGPELNGFAPAACSDGKNLYISLGDGSLCVLNEANQSWDVVAQTTPRIVHRLVTHAGTIYLIGGADGGDNLDLVEKVRLKPAT